MDEKDNEIDEAEKDLEKFDEMEKTFHRVVQDLISDQSFDHFREEYERLYEELLNSHKSNQMLIDRCKELNNSILANANKVSSVLTLSQNDQRTIAGLRHEFEKAWKMVELSQEKEQKSKEAIENLKAEISHLSRLVEQGGAQAFTQQASLQDISDQIAVLKKEIPVQTVQINTMKDQLSEAQTDTENLKAQIDTFTKEHDELQQNFDESKKQNTNIVSDIDKVMNDIIQTKNFIKSQQNTNQDIDDTINKQKRKIKNIEDDLHNEKLNVISANEDLQSSIGLVKQAQKTFQDRKKHTSKTNELIEKHTAEYADLEHTYNGFKARLDKVEEERSQLKEELADLKSYIKEIDQERSVYRKKITECSNEIIKLITEFNTTKNNNQTTRIKIERIIKDTRNISLKYGLEVQNTAMVEDQADFISYSILAVKEDQHEFRGKVVQLNADMNTYEDRTIEAKNGQIQIREEVKTREEQIDQNTMKANELQNQIKRQVSLTETVQNERDNASRQCQIAFKENESMLEKNDILSKQIKALKEEIREKDKLCVETHYKAKTILNQVVTLTRDVTKMKDDLKEMDLKTTEIRNLMTRSQFLLTSSDLETMKQKQCLNEIKASSDVMEKMTVRHVNEKEKLITKAHLVKCQIMHTKASYTKQTELIEKLKEELINESKKTSELMGKNRHGKALRNEIIRIQKSLCEMMGKSRALEEEIEKPMYVHRWRFLDSTNPEQAQLIRMNMTLRDRLMVLISRLENLMNVKKVLKDKAAVEERHLQNSYGGQFEAEYAYYNDILKDKIKTLQRMQQQASQQGSHVANTRDQLMTVRNMVREEKFELYDTKKKVGQIRAKTSYANKRNNNNMTKPVASIIKTETKYVGGGFAVGGIQAPQQMKPALRPQTRQQAIHGPNLILPQNATPRKNKSNLAVTKKMPRGWNPNRQPISPFLPTANGSDAY